MGNQPTKEFRLAAEELRIENSSGCNKLLICLDDIGVWSFPNPANLKELLEEIVNAAERARITYQHN